MKVVVVAKTRMGRGACIGGITFGGKSVRLIAHDAQFNEQFNQEYEVGDVWNVAYTADPAIVPPHVENIIVHSKKKLPPIENIEAFIENQMPPECGGVDCLFEGLAQATRAGAQYIAERTGVPSFSTMFWRPDRPLELCDDGKRIRYLYPTNNGGRTVTFVGFQEPLVAIPAGTLLRISLAHWWCPEERPDGEDRCYVQLSGWYLDRQDAVRPVLEPIQSEETELADEPELDDAQRLLQQVFGHNEFRPMQREIIHKVLQKQDSLVVMPTGSGKSICYQLPAIMFSGLTVVVSPLISLMQDQVQQLRQFGISAEFLNSTLPYHEHLHIADRIRAGLVKLLYAAPETLLRPETMLLLQNCRVDCFTIDEAHCISQWGHDFRPEYRQLLTLLERLPHATCLAVTATATERVRQDIKQTLHIRDADEFVASFDRKNLFLAVEPKTGSINQILDFLQEHQNEAGIIYCNTKREVNELTDTLVARGWPAMPYHADLDDRTRRHNQHRFIFEEGLIVVATIAFGMGINKSNVRFILHTGLPKNLENYYQQIGRAGRDGLRADCLLLYSGQDIGTIRYFINLQDESQRPGAWHRLKTMLSYAETMQCRRIPLLAYFGESAKEPSCDMCDNCLDNRPLKEDDITLPAQKFLSCVFRTGQIFGASHIIDVLRGSRAKSVLTRKHDQLSTYGIGREYSREQWKNLADQFLNLGLLQREIVHSSLKLTVKGHDVLHGERVTGRLPTGKTAASRQRSSNRRPDYDPILFDRLRTKRSELAKQAGIPPYVIFSDYSLSEMACNFPQSKKSFLRISGVGTYKLENYADEFLPIICAYCRDKGIAEKPWTQREP
jgi:ATP-dependent DNA helicase RecQ